MMRDAVKTIGNLIDKQSVGYISSIDEDGYPATKAMFAPRIRVGIKVFYFSTNTSSLRVSQYRENPKGCIYFCDRRFYRGVMLQGEFEILEEHEIKEKLWQEGDTMYYPLGIDDPDYCVLKFTAKKGRYYSQLKSETFMVSD